MDEFLFAPVRPRAVSTFRLALAIVVPFVFWPRAPILDLAVIPGEAIGDLYRSEFTRSWYGFVVAIAAIPFGLGCRPRRSGLVLVATCIPLMGVASGQQSRQVLLVALLGACALSAFGPIWPVRIIQLQLTVLYGYNALAKLTPEYLDGGVLEGLSIMRSNFLVDLSAGQVDLGPATVSTGVAAVTSVAVELFLAVAFWHPRLRWVAVVVGVGFHLQLARIVSIANLDVASVFLYLVFLIRWSTTPTCAQTGKRRRIQSAKSGSTTSSLSFGRIR